MKYLYLIIFSCLLAEPLFAKGITTSASYTWDLQGNPIGGRRQGFAQAGSLEGLLIADLEHYCGWRDTTLNISAIYRSGTNLSSSRYIDNIFWVSQIYGGETWWLNSLFLEKTFCNDYATLYIGRLNIGEYFAYSPLFDYYVSDGINDFIGSISENVFFHDTPYSTWAAIVNIRLHPQLHAQFGVFNANEEITNNAYNGFNFQFKNTQGIAYITQWTYLPRKQCLPGHYSTGAYYYTGKFARFLGGSVRGNWGIYLTADQTIRRLGTEGSLTPFVTFAYAPKAYNLFPYFFSLGVVAEGPFCCRPDDMGALGFAYGSFSSELRAIQRMGTSQQFGNHIQNFEAMVEATYAYQVNKCLTFQPDIQYIIKPNGRSDIANALVLGVQLIVNF